MNIRNTTRRAWLGTAVAALAAGLATTAPAPAAAQPKAYTSGAYRPTSSRPNPTENVSAGILRSRATK